MSDDREKRLNSMKAKIIQVEKENLKTHAKTTANMVETIRKIIINEAKKNY